MKKTNNQTTSLTPDQQAIANLSDSHEKRWETITEDELNDFSLMSNMLDLSKKAMSFQERRIYAFRWCSNNSKRVTKLAGASVPRPLAWKIVNATTLPDMADEVDNDLRCVARLDQILLFKKWADHAIVQARKMEIAEAGLQTGSLEGKKRQIQDKRDDVEAFSGKEHRISGGDEIMADESIMDNAAGISEDGSPLGDLVA